MRRAGIIVHLPLVCAIACAQAAEIVVTRLGDTNDGLCDSDCSLREAIGAADSGDTIDFQEGLTGTTTLHLGDLVIDRVLTIAGPGRSVLTISGGNTQRIFTITSHGDLSASGLTLAHGKGQYYAPQADALGGAVLNSGSFAFTDCTFSDNHADGTTGSVNNDAGAIYSDGYNKTLSIIRCTFEKNTAAAGACLDIDGGALTITDSTFVDNLSRLGVAAAVVANSNSPAVITGSTFAGNFQKTGGAIWVSGSGGTTIENSTLTGNSTELYGGAIYVAGILDMRNVTLSANKAAFGKNLFVASGGTVSVTNTIIADTSANCGGPGVITSAGHNLESGHACGLSGPGDLTDTPSNLVPLRDNGGPTLTMALTPCSAAADAASDATCPPVDQRGVPRAQGSHCDIGAFEWEQGHPYQISFCLDKSSLGWSAEPGASAYDLAFGRMPPQARTFNGDFSSFRTPSDVGGCASSCDASARVYDTSCVGASPAGLLEMWVVRAKGAGTETWDSGGNQVGTRDDSAGAPNPMGIPHTLVCP